MEVDKTFLLALILSLIPCITCINLDYRGYTEVPTIDIPVDEITISLKSNNIYELRDNEFSSFTKASTINLNYNAIHTISPTAFKGLENVLGTLQIADNLLTSSPDFSGFTNLRYLSLARNDIDVFPESIIDGTKLDHLDLGSNNLIELPDLRKVMATLTYLHVGDNSITKHLQTRLDVLTKLTYFNIANNPLSKTPLPDFTKVGEEASGSISLYLNNISLWAEDGTTFCQVQYFVSQYYPPGEVPSVDCSSTSKSQLTHVTLTSRKYTAATDFSNLTTFVETAATNDLNIGNNDFSSDFPNLPVQVRQSLLYLRLTRSNLQTISVDRLANYSLWFLYLQHNELTTLPLETFAIAERIYLDGNPWQEFSPEYWRSAICDNTVTKVSLTALEHYAQMQFMEKVTCSRSTSLQLKLTKMMDIPCDDSIYWMLRAWQTCQLDVGVDLSYPRKYPCGLASWDEVAAALIPPESFVMLTYANGNQTTEYTGPYAPMEEQYLVHVQLYAAHGEDLMCLIRDSTGNVIIQGEGVALIADGGPRSLFCFNNNVEIWKHDFPVDSLDECHYPVNSLTDGIPETCYPILHTAYSVQFKPTYAPLTSNVTYDVRIVTRGDVDCRSPFHVHMSREIVGFCTTYQPCQLVGSKTIRTQASDRQLCAFTCDCEAYECGDIFLKVATITKGGLCDIIIQPRGTETFDIGPSDTDSDVGSTGVDVDVTTAGTSTNLDTVGSATGSDAVASSVVANTGGANTGGSTNSAIDAALHDTSAADTGSDGWASPPTTATTTTMTHAPIPTTTTTTTTSTTTTTTTKKNPKG